MKTVLIILPFIICLYLLNAANASMSFIGNRYFSISELERISKEATTEKDSNNLSTSSKIIKAYHKSGFFDCSIKEGGNDTNQVVKINEGERSRIIGIILSGNTKVKTDTLLYHADFAPGIFFSESRVEELIDAMLKCYDDRGFPFCNISVEDVSRDSAGALITMAVDENIRCFFGKTVFTGALKTRSYVIERIMKLTEGASFSEEKLAKARERLFRSGLFESIDPPVISIKPGRRVTDITINLKEAAISSAEGVLGYKPQKSKTPEFSGYVDLNLRNIAGTMRGLRLHYLKEYPLTQADFYYFEPWIMKSNFDGELFFNFKIDEESYSFFESKLRVTFPISDNLKAFSGLTRSSTTYKTISSNDSILQTDYTTGSYAGMVLDLRDFPENPRKGIYLNVPLSIGIKSGSAGNFNEFKPEMFFECYYNPKGSHVLASLLHYASLITSDTNLHQAELLPLGGVTSLRGYRENQFYGKTILSMRNEYRYLLGKRGRGIIFLDLGSALDRSPDFWRGMRLNSIMAGYGVGFFMRTPAGYAGVDYGLGKGDPISGGKIHLILQNTF